MRKNAHEIAASRGWKVYEKGRDVTPPGKKRKAKSVARSRPKSVQTSRVMITMDVTRAELLRAIAYECLEQSRTRFRPICAASYFMRLPEKKLRQITTSGTVLELIFDLLSFRELYCPRSISGLMRRPLWLSRKDIADIACSAKGSNYLTGTHITRTLLKIAARPK